MSKVIQDQDKGSLSKIIDAINEAVGADVNPAFIITTLEIAKLDVIGAMKRVEPPAEPDNGVITLQR